MAIATELRRQTHYAVERGNSILGTREYDLDSTYCRSGGHGYAMRLRFVDGRLTETIICDADWESIKLQIGLPEHAASVAMPTFK